eukprot:PhM_4_TR15700/c3_g1_i1/m.85001
MDVVQHDPTTVLEALRHAVLGDLLLTLTQRDVVQLVVVVRDAVLLGHGLDLADGVDTRRQDKEDGRRRAGVLVRDREVHGLVGDEVLAELDTNEVLERLRETIWAQTTQHKEFLELREVLPVGGELFILGLLELDPLLPARGLGHVAGQRVEGRGGAVDLGERQHGLPVRDGAPAGHGLRRVDALLLGTTEQEAELLAVDLAGAGQDGEAKQRREDELVPLEQTTRDVAVDGLCDGGRDVLDTLLRVLGVRGLLCLLQGLVEDNHEGLQRVLVHVVDLAEVVDLEEQKGTTHSDGRVRQTRVCNRLLRNARGLHAGADLLRLGLRGLQVLNQRYVLENVAGGVCELEEEPVLALLQLNCHCVHVADEGDTLQLEIRALLVDDDGKELILKTGLCDHEVDERGLRVHLGLVNGVAQLRLQQQTEVLVVLDLGVTDLHEQLCTAGLLKRGASEHVVQDGLQRVGAVLDEDGETGLHAVL